MFQVYVEPEHIKHWCYGADGWTVPFAENDLRRGGRFRTGMRSPDGAIEFTFEGVYDEIAAPALIRYTIADGRKVTVRFDEIGGKTRITTEFTPETTHTVEQQRQGWSAILDHLAEHLANL